MRRKLVEQTPPPKCREKGWWTIVQEIENIIVLNVFCGGILKSRHCINISKKIMPHGFRAVNGLHASWNGAMT